MKQWHEARESDNHNDMSMNDCAAGGINTAHIFADDTKIFLSFKDTCKVEPKSDQYLTLLE